MEVAVDLKIFIMPAKKYYYLFETREQRNKFTGPDLTGFKTLSGLLINKRLFLLSEKTTNIGFFFLLFYFHSIIPFY